MAGARDGSAHRRWCIAPNRLRLVPQTREKPPFVKAIPGTGDPVRRRREIERRGHRDHRLHRCGKVRSRGKAEGESTAQRETDDGDAPVPDAGGEVGHRPTGVADRIETLMDS